MLYIMAESGKQPQWLAWKHFQLRQHILHVTVDFVIEFSIMFLKVNLIRCIFFKKNKHILYIEFIYSKNSVIIVTKSSTNQKMFACMPTF